MIYHSETGHFPTRSSAEFAEYQWHIRTWTFTIQTLLVLSEISEGKSPSCQGPKKKWGYRPQKKQESLKRYYFFPCVVHDLPPLLMVKSPDNLSVWWRNPRREHLEEQAFFLASRTESGRRPSRWKHSKGDTSSSTTLYIWSQYAARWWQKSPCFCVCVNKNL